MTVATSPKTVEVAPLFPSYAFVLIELQWHAARYALGVAAKAASSSVFPQWICPTVFGLNCLIGMF